MTLFKSQNVKYHLQLSFCHRVLFLSSNHADFPPLICTKLFKLIYFRSFGSFGSLVIQVKNKDGGPHIITLGNARLFKKPNASQTTTTKEEKENGVMYSICYSQVNCWSFRCYFLQKIYKTDDIYAYDCVVLSTGTWS